ncbi:MAG TPA: hypothetical protein PK720_02990 [bacterium]|jgi:hypothetical protein|nr:hypothetical protein [bacterium]
MDTSQQEDLNISALPPITKKRKEITKIIFSVLLIIASILFLISEVLPYAIDDSQSIISLILSFVLIYQGVIGLLLVYLYKKDIIIDSSDYSTAFKFFFIEIITLIISLIVIYIQLWTYLFVGVITFGQEQAHSDFYLILTTIIVTIINVVLMCIQSYYSIRSLMNKRIT